jgi:hypothetical protein
VLAGFSARLVVAIGDRAQGAWLIERAQRFGSEAALASNAVPIGTSLRVARGATWDLLGYEFAHLGAASRQCSVDVYVTGAQLYGRSRDA